MSSTGLRSFDSTIQKANIWINDVMKELGWDDRELAYRALRAVLHTLRDYLPINESVQFAGQLPQLLRGMYYEGWQPGRMHHKERHWEQFTDRVSKAFLDDLIAEPGKMTLNVLNVLTRHISPGEIEDAQRCLPEDIRNHWTRAQCHIEH